MYKGNIRSPPDTKLQSSDAMRTLESGASFELSYELAQIP